MTVAANHRRPRAQTWVIALVAVVPVVVLGFGVAAVLDRTGSDSTTMRDASADLPHSALLTVREMCPQERFGITAVTPLPPDSHMFRVECSYLPWGVPRPEEVHVACTRGEWVVQPQFAFVGEGSTWIGLGLRC